MKKTKQLQTLLATTLLALLPAIAPAANLTWDANTAVTGAQEGSGTWDTTANNWWTGSANSVFSIVTPDAPIFGNANGTAGTVTLGANIIAGNITFNAPSVGNYTIAGGGFNLSVTNRSIAANVNATISANIVPFLNGNSSLTLLSSAANGTVGILTLSGNNTFTNFNVGGNNPNTTAAVRLGSSTALGWGTVGIAGGQGSQTSHRIELIGNNLTVTNPLGNLGRNNNSAVVVNLGTGNVMSGTQTKTTGGQDTHWQSEVANGITFSGASANGLAFNSGAGSPRYFVLRGAGGGTVSGIISNNFNSGSSLGIVKVGSGIWTLAGQNFYTNQTIVNEGTLNLDYITQNNSKLSDTYPLTLAGGNLNLTNGSHTEVVSTTIVGAGSSSVTRGGGTSTLRMNAITRQRGGVVDFSAASIADTDSGNVNGILGGYATIAGANWAINSTGAGDGAVTAYSAYTDIAASGSTLADGAATNVRLNSAGSGGNIALGSATTTINTLLQNTTTAATIDTSSGVLRLGAIGGVLVPSTAQSLTIGTAANSGTLTAGGAASTAGEIVLINNSGNSLNVNSTVADNGAPVSLTKAGSGSATLTGNNTHTGTNTISGGTLNISSDANLGAVPVAATPSSILINGGTLNATADITLSVNRGIALGPTSRYGNGTIGANSGVTFFVPGIIASSDLTGNGPGGSLTKTGNGTLVLSGANTYPNGTIINGGTVVVSADNNLGLTPGCYLIDNVVLNSGTLLASNTFTMDTRRGIRLGPSGGSGSGTISVADTFALTFSGVISDNWNGSGSFTKAGNGTLILGGGLNDYVGNTTISAGTLQINNSRAIPNGSSHGNVVNNGTLALNGVNVAINGLSGGSSAIVDNITGTSITLSLGNNNQGGTFSGTIQNSGGGALTLSKTGSSTITLTGANNHSGNTLVTQGTLALSGAATLGSSTNIAVSSGATLSLTGLSSPLTLASGQVVSGSGIVSGALNTGNGTLAPGNLGSAGTLTNNSANLTLGSGSLLNYDLANVTTIGGGVNDYTVVNGNLTIAGPVTLNLNYLNVLPASTGKYTLMSWTGSFTGSPSDITAPSGFSIVTNGAAKTLELVINHTSASIVWVGNNGSAWDFTTANWNSLDNLFYNGDSPRFDDSAVTTGAISISAPVLANVITVSNTTAAYNFTGSSLSAGLLNKQNANTLTVENDLSVNGALISGGTLQIGNAGTSGTLAGGGVTNNAAIVANRSDALVITNPISGTGTFTQAGTGATSLNASNSYAGLTTVSAGSLQVPNGWALGSTAAGTTVASGAQLYLTLNVNVDNEALTLAGSGVATDGALRKGGGGTSTYGGAVTLTGNTTLKLDGNSVLNLTNAAGINGAAANASLLLAGDGGSSASIAGPISLGTGAVTNNGGSWLVAASNSYAGNTVINGGFYRITAPNSLGNQPGSWTPDRVTLNGGALEVFNGSNVALVDGKIGITLTTSSILGADTGATLTISNEISGTGDIQKWFPGLLILNGSNSWAGVLNTDGGSTTTSDGATRITRSEAVQNVSAINIRNNNGGSSTLQFDGTAGSVFIPQPMSLACRNVNIPCLQNLAGSNVLSGGISIQVGGADQWWQSDAGTLVFAGDVNYAGSLTGGRIYHFMGAGNHLVTGNINASPLGSPISVTKDGAGTLTLNGANTYGTLTSISNGLLLVNGSINHTGLVSVIGGTLGGNGTITAPVTVFTNGTLSPGSGIGALTINGDVILSGKTILEVNKAANTNDQVLITGAVTYGGTLYATNLAGTVNIGDSFTNFYATTQSGGFTNIIGSPGAGKLWSFTNGVLSVIAGVATNPTNITTSVSGSTLTLSWPADHIGWRLQVQTNPLASGLNQSGTWTDVPGSTTVNTINQTLNPANGAVFYRMVYP